MSIQKYMFEHLDNSLKELDVKTYMIENKAIKAGARTGFYALKGLTLTIRTLASLIFNAFKIIYKLTKNLKDVCYKVIILIISSPLAAKNKFCPSKAKQLEKRLDYFNTLLLKPRLPSVESLIGSKDKQISPYEKKELMISWLSNHLQSLSFQPKAQDLFDSMLSLANGDISKSNLVEIEKKAILLSKELRSRNPYSPLTRGIKVFIEIFKEERKFENSLQVKDCQKDIKILLKHPNLLKRSDIRSYVTTLTGSLKSKIDNQTDKVLQRLLLNAHQNEQQAFHHLATLFITLSQLDLRDKYLSSTETAYLREQLKSIEEKIRVLKNNKEDKGFELRLLEIEKTHLLEQSKSSVHANDTLNRLTGEQIQKANESSNQEASALSAKIIDRIEASLKNIKKSSFQNSIALTEIEKLEKELEELKKQTPFQLFNDLPNFILKLQQIEKLNLLSLIKQNDQSILDNLFHPSYLTDYEKSVYLHKEGLPWKDIKNLMNLKEREAKRKEDFAKDTICLLLEKKSDCQSILKFIEKDLQLPHSINSLNKISNKAKLKIKQSALEFIDSIQKKYSHLIQQKLYSFTEFATHIQKKGRLEELENLKAIPQNKERKIDFEQLSLELDITEPLNQWYHSLQMIWAEHLPREEEETINALSNKNSRNKKIAESFASWCLVVIGRKILTPLSFEGIVIKNQSVKRRLALKRLENLNKKIKAETRISIAKKNRSKKQAPITKKGFEPTLQRIRKKIEARSKKQALLSKKGFNFDLIGHILPTNDSISIDSTSYPFNAVIGNASKSSDLIEILIKVKKDINASCVGLDQNIRWVKELAQNPHLKNLRDLKLHLLAECRFIIQESFNKKIDVPSNIQDIFLNLYCSSSTFTKKKELNFETLSNIEREDFLNTYLKMIFAKQNIITLTDSERSYLIQFLSLSTLDPSTRDTIKKCFSIGAISTINSSFKFNEVGKNLQTSIVSLEGVEEKTLQETFQQAIISEDSETRKWIDALRARGSNDLSLYLLNYVYEFHDVNHDQGREAIQRMISHISKNDPKSVTQFLKDQLKTNTNLSLDDHTLAPTLAIFYQDLIFELDSTKTYDQSIQNFNNQVLIGSNEANRMLMGYAREITRLTYQQIRPHFNKNDFFTLLKYKIAYQNIKLNYFDGKKEIKGFLKLETAKAEAAMALSFIFIQTKLNDPQLINELALYLNSIQKPVSHADKVIKEELKKSNSNQLTLTGVPGWIKVGSRIAIDATLGVIYNDGEQQMSLPAYLKNHPAVRALKINHLPYTWNAFENAFIYYTKEKGVKIPQIILKEANNQPIIQKRLSLDFDSLPSQIKNIDHLQFVPKEEISLPHSVLYHLKIKSFWQDRQGDLYGYDESSNLIGIIKKTASNQYSIQLQDENYHFIQNYPEKPTPLLTRLLDTFDLTEILVNSDNEAFYIPFAKLKLTNQVLEEKTIAGKNKEPKQIWISEQEGGERKIVDFSHPLPFLFFKNEKTEQKTADIQRQLKELYYRLDLEQKQGASYIDKYKVINFEKRINQLKNQLNSIEECTFIQKLPEEFSIEEKIDQLKNMIPANFSHYFSFDPSSCFENVLADILIRLKEIISDLSKNADAQDTALQADIANLSEAYQNILLKYEETSQQSGQLVTFKENSNGSFSSTDLTGALVLALNKLKSHPDNEPSDYLLIIEELAKYPLYQPLSDSALKLLDQTIKNLELIDQDPYLIQLEAYLKLIKYMHFFYKMQELTHTLLSDKVHVDNTEKNYLLIEGRIRNTVDLFDDFLKADDSIIVSNELQLLFNKTNFIPSNLASQKIKATVDISHHIKIPVIDEIQAYSNENLLERFFVSDAILAKTKEVKQELSSQQLSLIKSFYQHSPDQVKGFYLEEMGRFNLSGFYSEFKLDKKDNRALFGLKKEDINHIFQFLIDKKYIKEELNGYYCLQSMDIALSSFNPDAIKALISAKSLSKQQAHKITQRLNAFLFKAMQSGFRFSIKKTRENEIDQKLEIEKKIHLQKYLEAESILKAELETLKISWTDLKYAVISEDYLYFNGIDPSTIKRLSNAMILYLFHKTEVQHIENIQKAPIIGERNKIELLQTRRNYSVDRLFQEGLKDEARYEQIMQRAFLAFEEDYGYRCNIMQIRMFRSLLLDTHHEEAIDAAQARMGFGKTALLPLMAIIRIAFEKNNQNKHLVRYVVPKAVIEDNKSSFHKKLSSILGSHVVKDQDFIRYQIDQDNPNHSFELILKDLQSRLTFYLETIDQGNVLVQWPEIRNSMEAQELDFGKMITENEVKGQTLELCLQSKKLLGQIRSLATYTVFDELDDTQDIKSREVNFTTGNKIPINHSTIRPLEKIISFIDKNRNKDWKNLTDRAEELVRALCTDNKGSKIKKCLAPLLNYLTDRNTEINEETKHLLSSKLRKHLEEGTGTAEHSENDSLLFLIRALLLDENILALIKNKQPNTHFGVRFIENKGERTYFQDPESKSALLIAVPYEGTNTPKGLSIFDNTEVAALTTMRYYFSPETLLLVHPHLDFLIAQVRNDAIPEDLSEHYLKNLKDKQGKPVADLLKEMGGMLDAEEIKIAKEYFYEEFMRKPSEDFRKFFGMAVVATQIRSDEACAKSDRYEKGSVDNIEKGCSGTVGGTSAYFAKQETDPAADGKLSIEIMGRANNSPIISLDLPQPDLDYLEQIISTLLAHSYPHTRAIVDAAGICKSRNGTPESVVAELWKQLKMKQKFSTIEGIIFYGKDNIKKLYRGPNRLAIACTTEMELAALSEKKYFSFYGQKNTRGSDIKQANDTHTLVTLDENVTNSDAKQAVLRFRNLVNRDSKQTFSFAVMPNFENVLKETLKAEVIKFKNKAEQELAKLNNPRIVYPSEVKTPQQQKQWLIEARQSLTLQIKTLQEKITKIEDMSLDIDDDQPLESKDIANYLRLQEKEAEEKTALNIFRKEMKAYIQQAASHLEHHLLNQISNQWTDLEKQAYVDYLTKRKDISSFVQFSIENLYLKYGTSTKNIDRDHFITQEREIFDKNLDKLFEIAEEFAQKIKGSVSLKKEFYFNLCERSIEIFKTRFESDTPVQITNVNAQAQAVAQAIAEALAQAEAEALAEKLAESELQVLDRIKLPEVAMAKTPFVPFNLDFLQSRKLCYPATQSIFIKKLIRYDLINYFEMSPLLSQSKLMVSHFFLAKVNEPFILISQQEADLILEKAKLSNVLNGYTLYDARQMDDSLIPAGISLDLTLDMVKQIPCMILGDNQVPVAPIPTTNALRSVALTNVANAQLLPKMAMQTQISGSKEPLATYFDIGHFGVAGNFKFSIKILAPSARDQNIEIEVSSMKTGKFSIAIPRDNKYLNQFITQAFSENKTSKFHRVKELLDKEYDQYKLEIQKLNEEKKKIDELDNKLKAVVKNVRNFTVTQDMQDGLRVRDSQYYDYMATFGDAFTGALTNINNAQQIFSTTSTINNLQLLKNSFEAFVSLDRIANLNIHNLATQPLMTKEEWNDVKFPKKENFKPLEKVYGRILHEVHGSDIRDAKSCSRKDCHNMFAKTLPDMIQTIQSLNSTIEQITKLEKQKQEIQDKIDIMAAKIKGLPEAMVSVEKILNDQKNIEQKFKLKGLIFATGQFFDRFALQDFNSWQTDITLEGLTSLPDYQFVINEGMKLYQQAIKALTEKESETFMKNQHFLAHVLALSEEITDRSKEVEIK